MNETDFYIILQELLSEKIKTKVEKQVFYETFLDLVNQYFSATGCSLIRSRRKDENVVTKGLDRSKTKQMSVLSFESRIPDSSLVIFDPDFAINGLPPTLMNKPIIELVDYPIERQKTFTFLKSYLEIADESNYLIEAAYYDELTSLQNNRALKIRTIKPLFKKIGVVFIDANGLKALNDTYGHEKGDEFLKTLAQMMKNKFRIGDLYRRSGDEFIIICENIDESLFAQKVDAVKQTIKESEYSASFGICYYEQIEDINKVIAEAEMKMYEAKIEYKKKHAPILQYKYTTPKNGKI